MKTRVFLITLALTLVHSICTAGSVYKLYVSTKGSDSNPGTGKQPLASLQGALARVIALQGDDKIEKFVVDVDAGEYQSLDALVINHTLDKPIEFRGSSSGQSVMCGGMKTAQFSVVNEKLWRVFIPEVVRYGFRFEQIYINGERRFRAQTPNRGEFASITNVKEIAVDSTNLGRDIKGWEVLCITPKEKLPFGNKCRTKYIAESPAIPSQGKLKIGEAMGQPLLTFYHKWDVSRRPLQHIDTCGIMYFTGVEPDPWNNINTRSRFVAENDANFMDAAGEWILCEDGWLYYIPCEGETVENVTCKIPVTERFIQINGKSMESMVENVTFSNLHFECASYITPFKGNNQMQAAAGIGTVVEVNFARNINFTDCSFAHTGLGGIWFKRGCSDCSVQRCHIYDLGASGVKLGETVIRDNHDEITRNITIDNNIIQHGGMVFPSAVGVTIFNASDNKITHNDIADFRYTGVSVGWVWGYSFSPSKRNIIEYNHIHHLGWAQLSDMGGVYTLGSSEGTSISNNVLHHIYSLYYGGWGLYNDEGSSGIRLENNLVYNCKSGGYHQHYGKENIIKNNIFANQIRTQLEASRIEQHLSFNFTNNIVYYNSGSLCGINWKNVGHKSDYNCYYCTNASEKIDFQGLSFSEWQHKGQDTHSFIEDPIFTDIQAKNFTPKNKELLKKIGFRMFDYSKAGVYGSKKWKQKAELSNEMKAAFDKLVKDYEEQNITDW